MNTLIELYEKYESADEKELIEKIRGKFFEKRDELRRIDKALSNMQEEYSQLEMRRHHVSEEMQKIDEDFHSLLTIEDDDEIGLVAYGEEL